MVEAWKPLVYYIRGRILSIFSFVVPKDDKMIIFISTPDFSDNPRYLYEEAKKKLKDYKFVWIVDRANMFNKISLKENTIFVERGSFQLLKYLLRAKYIVASHGVPYWKSRNQIMILLWHGLPIKGIGETSVKIKVPKTNVLYWFRKSLSMTDYFVTTSKFSWLIFLSEKFISGKTKAIFCGQPRCDALFQSKEQSVKTLSKIIKINVKKYDQIVLYLPTFRDYNSTITRKIIENLTINKDLIDFLDHNNVLFLIKPHPLDKALSCAQFELHELTNFRFLKNEDLLNNFLTLYDILPAVDILVTDYSSVYFDYLLLNRPIVFYVPDLEEYKEIRGFILEPYEKWTPGDKARTPRELILALSEAVNNPKKWERERLWLRDIMFKYQDGKASERIIKYFWLT